MAFSPFQSQDATAVLSFVSQHKSQIRQKAAAHAGIDFQDYQQEVVLFILENDRKFDPSRGSFASFVFGHVERRLYRRLDDALSRARSMDDDSEHGRSFRERVEALTAGDTVESDDIFKRAASEAAARGVEDLVSVVDAMSGKSAVEIAQRLGITERRVNQKLARLRADAQRPQRQLGFFLVGGEVA